MKKILNIRLISNENYEKFTNELMLAILSYQSDGLEVEVQYSTSVYGTNAILIHSALLLIKSEI